MKKCRTWIIAGAGLSVFGLAASLIYLACSWISIGVAYKAKTLCSGIFVAHRSSASLLNADLLADDLAVLRHVGADIDYGTKLVVAQFLVTRKAVYRPGRGCTLNYGTPEDRAQEVAADSAPTLPARPDPRPWPVGEADAISPVARELDSAKLDAAINQAFSEPDPARLRRTRAVIVVYNGRLVAERYAPGFNKDTPLLGWSLTKGAINALAGIAVKDGKLALNRPVPLPQWRGAGDARGKITLDHLLRMSSGLYFNENGRFLLKDLTRMLLMTPDTAAYAAEKPLQAAPGTKWSYSSGTANILSRVLRDAVGEANYPTFPRRALFDRIGMRSAVMEMDAAGTFVGSSFMYATARDWARLGLLYLQDGTWQGRRILPQGWVQYTRTPAPAAPDKEYGAHFWLRIPAEFRSGDDRAILPADAFHAVGYEGQFVTIIPSRRLVVVRLGLTRCPNTWAQDTFIASVLAAIPGSAAAYAASRP